MRIIDRYMAREFSGPFLGAAAGFTVMLLSSMLFELTDLIIEKKMPVQTVLRMLFYKLPGVIVISLPIALLFAAIIALGRMAKDSEITVLRGTGMPFRRLVLPPFLFALVISAFSFVLNEWIVPSSNHQAETILRQAIFRDPLPSIEEELFFKGADGRYFYVGRVDRATQSLQNILIYQVGKGRFPEMITAVKGRYEDNVWYLEDGIRKKMDDDGFTMEDSGFESMEYPVTEGSDLFLGRQKSTDEMTRRELGDHIRLFQSAGIDMKRFEVDYHMKLSMPMAGLTWALTGAPLSLRSARSGRFFGIVAAILLAFAYFVSASLFRSLGGNGILPPFVAAWSTNAIFLGVGGFLMVRADRV